MNSLRGCKSPSMSELGEFNRNQKEKLSETVNFVRISSMFPCSWIFFAKHFYQILMKNSNENDGKSADKTKIFTKRYFGGG